MMKKIELDKRKVYCGNLLLVNASYPLRNSNIGDLLPADAYHIRIVLRNVKEYHYPVF